jgi:outer membrane protein OmpA-like peptidoglycan-associated protein
MSFNFRKPLVLSAAILFAGCTSSLSQIDDQGMTEEPEFPAAEAADNSGRYVAENTLRMLKPGMEKRQIQALIGAPHFREGFPIQRVREWDYLVHIKMNDGSEKTCQLKVLFDSNLQAGSYHYLPEDCMQVAAERRVNISADFLFAFASSQLSLQGQSELSRIVAELDSQRGDRTTIDVVGYTDYIGSDASNLELSIARAKTVAEYLIRYGIPASTVRYHGLGEADPVVHCSGPINDETKQCLAPNRRVSLIIRN